MEQLQADGALVQFVVELGSPSAEMLQLHCIADLTCNARLVPAVSAALRVRLNAG